MTTPTPKPQAATGAGIRTVQVRTSRRTQMVNVTGQVQKLVTESAVAEGSCQLYVPHTTAAVTINEGYDPDVARDMEAALDRLIPRSGDYRHAEGNSDSHIKTALIGTTETVWIVNGKLALGRWQAIFFCEFDGPRQRELCVKIVPDPS